MQEQTQSSKWWKWLASLTMIALRTIFEMNFVEVWQSSQTCQFFLIQRSTRICVEEPKCNGQFLAIVTQMEQLLLFFHNMQNESCTRHVPCIRYEPWQFLQFCIKFNHLGVILILYIWTSLFNSIQVQPGCFFKPFSFPCHSMFSLRWLLPAAA